MGIHLLHCCKYLDAVFRWDTPDEGTHTLIFTCWGKTRHFKLIEELVARAPAIPGWHFEALYQPCEQGVIIDTRMEQIIITPADCWFKIVGLVDESGPEHLDIFIETQGIDSHLLQLALNRLVLYILGEKVYGHRISGITVRNLLTQSPRQREKLIPLSQLPRYITLQETSTLSINEQGMITERK